MKDVAYILFGAAFTIAVATGLGSLLLRRLRISLYREESILFAFLSGAVVLSFATFLLCVLQIATKGVLLSGGIAVLAWVWHERAKTSPLPSLPPAPRGWNLLFLVIVTGFFILYFFNALAPEVSPDGSGYHLANVARMWKHHGFDWGFHSIYADFPQGTEMLFLFAFVFGHASSAALVHLVFLLSLILLIVCYGRRYGFPQVGLFAAVLVFVSPVAGKAGSSAYNDLAVTATCFGLFYLLQIWDEVQLPGFLILIGLLAGFAYATKYSAGIALPFAAGYLWWRKGGSREGWRVLLIFVCAATVVVLPWILRNWIWVGNPFAPLLNRWFPTPYYYPGMEQTYLADVRHYEGLAHWWEIPWRHLVSGELVGGIVGPIFLLTPLALLALRDSRVRRLLFAGLIFGLPAVLNAQTRFLLPALPFISLALGQALTKWQTLLPVVALAHTIAGVPAVVALYSNRYNWRLESLPIAAALRLMPEPDFLAEHIPDYPLKYTLERATAPDAKFFTWSVEESAYVNRNLSSWYESARGYLGVDLLSIPLQTDEQPTVSLHLRFLPVTARRLRVVETASARRDWTIAELRLFSQGREVPRSADWKLDAHPNPWQARLAFDDNEASRWSSWQSMQPGMYVAVDFGKAQTVDEVVCEMAPDQGAQLQVEIASGEGKWEPLTTTVQAGTTRLPSDMRRPAIRSLKAQGITHLVLRNTDPPAGDIRNNPDRWGLEEAGVVGPLHIYRLE